MSLGVPHVGQPRYRLANQNDVTLEDFLSLVVTPSAGRGWFCLLIGPPAKAWYEKWFAWPDQIDDIVRTVDKHTEDNVYFSAHLFAEQRSTKDNVLTNRTIQADLDEAQLSDLPVKPTALVETSDGRHQAYWVLDGQLGNDELELLSKRVSYSIRNCDLSGWSLGHKVRVPTSFNYKYTPRRRVKVVELGGTVDHVALGNKLVSNVSLNTGQDDEEWVNKERNPDECTPLELLESIRGAIPRKTYGHYNRVQNDRSAALWGLMVRAFTAGCNRDEVWCLAWHSANNKFADNKYGGERDLAKDVLRAEQVYFANSGVETSKQVVIETRRTPGTQQERRQYVADAVIEMMNKKGEFAYSDDGGYWFLDHGRGKPVQLTKYSQELENILISEYGINAAEGEARFVVNQLIGQAYEHGKPVNVYSLSWFDWQSRSVLLHNGTSQVHLIDAHGMQRGFNGQYGVLFPWQLGVQSYDIGNPLGEDWAEWLFQGFFNNLSELTREQAMALVKTWFLFLFFRNASDSRPILALFGQPGSGKSAFFRIVYRVLYGTRKSLDAVSSSDNFDQSVSSYPLVVFDNVDTYAPWLTDRLALAASTSDVVKRKLYTDSDNIVLKRQAMVGITAHNPKFGREDIVDRLILVNMSRLSQFGSETEMMRRVDNERERIWGSIVSDLQRVLACEWPTENTIPEFRINDFAKYGTWISRALGYEDVFRSAIAETKQNQLQFNLTEEGILIDALDKWVKHRKAPAGEWYTQGQLWELMQMYASDHNGLVKIYRDTKTFSKKLVNLEETLKEVFDVAYYTDEVNFRTYWRIDPK